MKPGNRAPIFDIWVLVFSAERIEGLERGDAEPDGSGWTALRPFFGGSLAFMPFIFECATIKSDRFAGIWAHLSRPGPGIRSGGLLRLLNLDTGAQQLQRHPEAGAEKAIVAHLHKARLQMTNGTDNAYRLAKKYKIKTAWGTDTLFDATLATKQGKQLAKMVRWYKPAEVLRMATSTNAELLALSGPRNAYVGRLGVVEEGALADLLLVDGDPISDLKLIEDPAKNFLVIMKDGKIFKNIVP